MAITASLLAAGVLSSCDSQDDRPLPAASPHDIVSPKGSDDEHLPTRVQLARKLADGETQVVVDGGSCVSLSDVEADERTSYVIVHAYVVDTSGGGACTMEIVPWLTPLRLKEPLGERRLVDWSAGKDVSVVDCKTMGSHPLCSERPMS